MKAKEVNKNQKKWTLAETVPGDVLALVKDYPKWMVQVLWNRGIFGNPTTLHSSLKLRTTRKLRGTSEFTNGTNATNKDKGWIPVVARMTREGKGFLDKPGMIEQIENFLNPDYESNLHDPFLLKDMDKAVERILKAVKNKEKICIYGDYDVDGVTATALLSDLFEKLGADFMTYIPSRHDEGYGLNKEAIDELAKENVNLIITVDCGVRSVEEVEHINSSGMEIIITDHHEVGQKQNLKNKKQKIYILPNAVAVINPKRSDCLYPFKDLAGVGVAFKLACAVLSKDLILAKGWEKWLLDLVALGTVCDVVSLTGENRVLVKYGLKVMARTKREGLKALAKSAGVDLQKINSHNLGFHLGPRLNASGRLEHAKHSLDLLLTKDLKTAEELAGSLSEVNKERQEITSKILAEAREMLEKIDDDRNIILLKNKGWPSGVVGIVASRLMDECGKPVLLLEEGEEESKGSARSIDNFNLIAALEKCDDFLVKYGGHKKAAGLTVKNEHFILLEERLITIGREIKKEDLAVEIKIDTKINPADINEKTAEFLNKLEPYGFGNKKPVFLVEGVELSSIKLVGNEKNHMKYSFKKDGATVPSIAFNSKNELGLAEGDEVDIVCAITENEWMNRVTVETRTADIRKV